MYASVDQLSWNKLGAITKSQEVTKNLWIHFV